MGCSRPVSLGNDAEVALARLDSLLEERDLYYQEREADLTSLRDQLSPSQPEEDRYETLMALAQGYRSYRFDSALFYVEQSVEVGTRLGPSEARAAQFEEAYCYLSAGLFLEADEVLGAIDRSSLSRIEQTELHLLEMKKYIDMTDYNRHSEEIAQKYRESGIQHADSALALLHQGIRWDMTKIHQLILQQRPIEARELAIALLDKKALSDRERAIVLYHLGAIAHTLGKEDESVIYLARSAGYDITTGTHETTSMARLATELYRQGEIGRALRYIDVAMEDANFFDARHRKMTVGDIRPMIEESHLQDLDRQRRQMLASTITVSLLCILLLTAILVIVLQMRRLRRAAADIVEKSRLMEETNERLKEANTIKDEYIGSSFYRQGGYIHEQEELYRFVLKHLQTKEYEAIRKRFKQSEVVRERKDMYADFDRTFTHLFPTFVSEYISLFPKEESSTEVEEGSLTPEMRIFALIRLGITKNEQIANFLNYSVNTINTYKTRAKNRSIVDNKDFENEVMKIGRSS